MPKTRSQTTITIQASTVPSILIASESNATPMACVAVTIAVFGNTNENLVLLALIKEGNGNKEDRPSHIKFDMMPRIIHIHQLPMCTNADYEEPEAETPQPEPRHVREKFEEKSCFRFATISIRHDFHREDISKMYDSCDCESTWTNGHELVMLVYFGK